MQRIVILFAITLLLLPSGAFATTSEVKKEIERIAIEKIAPAFSPATPSDERRQKIIAIMHSLPLDFLARLAFGRTLENRKECIRKNPEGALLRLLTSNKITDLFLEPVREYELGTIRQIDEHTWRVVVKIHRASSGERHVPPQWYRWTVQLIDGQLYITNLRAKGIDFRGFLTNYIRSNEMECPDHTIAEQ